MIFTYKNLEIGLLIIIFICHHWYYKKINTSLSCVLYRRPAVIFRVPNRPISGDDAEYHWRRRAYISRGLIAYNGLTGR